ncbi:DNA binding domain, excisionase family protein [Verrucomicrobiia bacterium DG1235]|nr:DNA binding domain, excisionase family protein [Verrucomicrobiae bacterium DG1235]
MLPENEKFTTQAAANYLGMSRQFLVNLLENGDLPFHKVGSHRRITFKDLIAYEKARDSKRRKSLDALSEQVETAGLYDASYQGE